LVTKNLFPSFARKRTGDMKGRISNRRNFVSNAVQHIYQRTEDHGVLFYTVEDRLVYYTIAAAQSKTHDIRVVAAAIMFTHIHQSILADSLNDIHSYIHDVNTKFARLYNFRYGRKGRLFEKYPGRSQKSDSKSIRTNIIYVFNNHVEKGLCSSAVEERWSLLAYSVKRNPFSEKLLREKASGIMRRALNTVDRRIARHQNLEYKDLDKILPYLNSIEKEQYIDYVISNYSLISFRIPTAAFGSINALIMAANSTTGSEYDIHEEYSPVSDMHYVRLCGTAEKQGFLKNLFTMDNDMRTKLMVHLARNSCVPLLSLKKFFHHFD